MATSSKKRRAQQRRKPATCRATLLGYTPAEIAKLWRVAALLEKSIRAGARLKDPARAA
jgi:hypothetical protein